MGRRKLVRKAAADAAPSTVVENAERPLLEKSEDVPRDNVPLILKLTAIEDQNPETPATQAAASPQAAESQASSERELASGDERTLIVCM